MKRGIQLSVILIFGLAAYSNSFTVPFLFDDFRNIVKSEVVQDYWKISEDVSLEKKIYSRPLTNLTYALNYAMAGTEVGSYHAFNLMVHLLTALLLYGVIRRSFLTDRLKEKYSSVASWLAFAVTLLWTVHPLQTQCVTYVVQRAEALAAFFYLFSLYCVIRGATTTPYALWSFLAVLGCFLGMGSKQVMVTAPLLIFVYDRIFLTTSFREIFQKRKWIYFGFALSLLLLGALVLNDAGINPRPSAGFGIEQITPWQYAVNQPAVILHYLRLSVWPHPLVFDYLWPLASVSSLPVLLPLVAVSLLLVLTAAALKWNAPIGFLMLWFFLILSPTSSFVPIGDPAVEHRMYLPLAGVLMLLAVIALSLFRRIADLYIIPAKLLSAAALLTVCLLASGFTGMTIHRNATYQSEISLWKDTIEKRPQNFRALTGLGNAYIKARQFREAEKPFRDALELNPESAITHYNFALALIKIGSVEDSIRHYEKAVSMDPTLKNAGYHAVMGDVLRSLGRLKESRLQYTQAVEMAPENIDAQFGMGVLFAAQGRVDEAAAQYTRVLELKPDHTRAHNNLGTLLVKKGEVVEALRHFAKALTLDPNYETARKNFLILNEQLEILRKSQDA